MSDNSLQTSSNALQDLAQLFYEASRTASERIKGNLRLEAIHKDSSVTERFWAYMEMGLDNKTVGNDTPMRVTAVAFTDRGDATEDIEIGADMACFVRYDLPGLRWAKGFLGQSKLAKVTGQNSKGVPTIALPNEESYDRMIKQCAAMGNISDESYVFFFSPESVTVEKANNLLGDLGENYPEKPWQDIHQHRKDSPVDIAQFYAAVAACQLGEAMLDRPVKAEKTVFDYVESRQIQTVLLLMVGTVPPQKPIRPDSPEINALAAPVPETYWKWTDLFQTLIKR